MSDVADRILADLSKLVGFITRRYRTFATTGVRLLRQVGDGYDTKPDDPDVPGDEKVPYLTGLPGFKVRTPKGVRGAAIFLQGPADDAPRPRVSAWESGCSVDEVAFDGGTKGVARVGDAGDAGMLIFTSGGTFAGYTPPSSDPVAIAARAAAKAAAIAAGSAPIDLTVILTSGSPKLKA